MYGHVRLEKISFLQRQLAEEKRRREEDILALQEEEILKSKKALAEELRQCRNEIELKNSTSKVDIQVEEQKTVELSQKLESVAQENLSLIERINNLQNEQSVSTTKIEELESVIDSRDTKIEELNKTVSEYKQQITDKNKESSSVVEDLENAYVLKNKLESEVFDARTALENSQKDVEEMKKHFNLLQVNDARNNEVIKDLNDTVRFKDEEILKFQAVVEEKTIEHMNTFRKLKQHEEMTRITIKDFQKEIQELKIKIKDLEEKRQPEQGERNEGVLEVSKYDGIIKELMENCSLQKAEDLPTAISEMNSEIASLRCERDRLSEDLKDTQVVVDTLETEKVYIDLEKECEDLRDQLEELQCGERVVPEGSLTPRPLPTIKEEEDVQSSSQFEGENDSSKNIENRTVEGTGGSELIEKINELNSQVAALSEARQNLEMELSFVRKEKLETDQRLSESLSRLGNLSNLEAEAVNLRHENESLQSHLNNLNKRLENVGCVHEEKVQLEKQIQQMSEAAQRMSLESAHTYTDDEVEFMRVSLEGKIDIQNRSINEYKEEILKLKSYINSINNTTDNYAHLQEKVTQLETDLDSAKSAIIYKEDQIDDLKRAIEQIGSIFQLSGCDSRQTYVNVKQIYDSLITKLKDSSTDLFDLKEELELLKKENMKKNNNENEVIRKLTAEIQFLKSELSSSKNEFERMHHENESLLKKHIENIGDLKVQCEILQNEKGSLISKLELQKEEERNLHNQLNMISEKNAALESSIKSNDNTIKKLETDFSAKENSLNNRIKSLEQDLVSKVEKSNGEAMKSLEEHFKESVETLKKENEELQSQLTDLKTERLRMIETSTLKHQESVTYYNEIQRLNDVIRKEEQRKSLEITALNEKLKELTFEKEKSLCELNALKLNWEATVRESLPKSEAQRLQEECNRMNQEIIKLNEELKKQQESYKTLLKERDHLRMANSSFNTQYEEKSREWSESQVFFIICFESDFKCFNFEVEETYTNEAVEVEETYTNEAVKSEQREASLRQSLAKMHEKIASRSTHYSNENQKTTAQLEAIQEQLSEAIHERDETRAQLLVVQESSEQHQEALTRLQNVLQDFQKNQTREISLAIEREKRKLEEEKKRNTELELQLRIVNVRQKEIESTVASTASLRDELQAKEDTIVALKSQVNAVNVAARKSQEQVALLQTASDAKVDKNLFVGYFATPTDKQREVLRIVAEVLDFSPEERSRTGIDQQPGSWLTSIANFLAPPPSNIRVSSKVDLLDHSSLSQAFIRFLEEESSPKTHAKLPAVQMAEEANQKAQKKAQAKNNSLGNNIYESVLNMNPNSSSVPSSTETINTLLLSSTSSLQGNFPLISTPAVSSAPILSTTSSEEIPTPKFLHNLLNSNDNNEGTGSGS
ncbi:Thyroid receptor-interacting protein 11 [Armadillidium nasatum]|uniref:Thyroid receptor-interacting protein 11 n=1 Tax=Armadillidium nasatum TaxID=96803 RepID=A0A5N5TPP4_9CRUS|nr:Thyroid receptor-interacting protein 11 [Armadillidium nasatum]